VTYVPPTRGILVKAKRGNTRAQYSLGRFYYRIAEDYPEAVKWFRMAAERWHAPAQVSLGQCFLMGRGVELNPDEAEKWFRAAAEQGDWTGQQRLGEFYALRRGLPLRDEEAYFWLLLAERCRKDKLPSRYYEIFAKHYASILDSAAQRLPPQRRSQAESRAEEWKPSPWSVTEGRLL
jgi:TPR repeat protein